MPLFYIFTNNDNCTEVLMSVMFEPEQVLSKDFGFGLQGTNAIFFFFIFFFSFFYFMPQVSHSNRTANRATLKENNKFLQDIWGSNFLQQVPK